MVGVFGRAQPDSRFAADVAGGSIRSCTDQMSNWPATPSAPVSLKRRRCNLSFGMVGLKGEAVNVDGGCGDVAGHGGHHSNPPCSSSTNQVDLAAGATDALTDSG